MSIDMTSIDRMMLDPETGRLVTDNLNLTNMLYVQVNRVLSVFSQVSSFDGLAEFEKNITLLVKCLEGCEGLVAGYLDEQYWKEKREMENTSLDPFEKVYAEWLADKRPWQYPDQFRVPKERKKYELGFKQEQATKWFYAFMAWVKRSGMGFERDKPLNVGRKAKK